MVKADVLAALDAARGKYISGQALAQQLGISLQSLMMANPTFTPTDFLKGRLVCIPVRA